jgi:molecular chaperone GrpE
MRSDQGDERTEVDLDADSVDIGRAEVEVGTGSPEMGEKEADSGYDAELLGAREKYLRLAAEFENYRKRTDRERGEGSVRAQAKLVQQLLEPLDDLQRVAHFTAENATAESLLEGVQMVERKLMRVLESAGLAVVEAKGERFDPSRHEAIMAAEAESHEDDESVGEVFQNGYEFKGVLLRPARVQVKKFNG